MGPAQRQSQLADLEAQKKQKEEDEVNDDSVANHYSVYHPGKCAKVYSDENNGPPSVTGRESSGLVINNISIVPWAE